MASSERNMASSERNMASNEKNYFESYGNLSVHELMLKDRPRTLAYRKFFESNPHVVKDKVVMDVGAGTGVLSLFAASAGAKKVYAVEASDVALLCEGVVKDNDLDGIIEVIHGAVEDISLPEGTTVDVIISEWMGFYLLHESMLDSVICARDRFLSPSGIMVPSSAILYLAPVDMTLHFQERAEEWSNVYGFDFSSVASAINLKEVSEPLIQTLSHDVIRSEPQEVIRLDLKTVTIEHVRRFSKCLKFSINKESMVHGFAAWFTVLFSAESLEPSSSIANSSLDISESIEKGKGERTLDVDSQKHSVGEKGDACVDIKTNSENQLSCDNVKTLTADSAVVALATGPADQPTHWKQTVIFLPQTCLVEKGIEMFCIIRMAQDSLNKRHYNITLELTDSDVMDTASEEAEQSNDELSGEESDASTDHPVPCHCGSDRCRLIAALVERYDTEHDQLGEEAEMLELEAEVEAAKQLDAEIETEGWQIDSNISETSIDGGDEKHKDNL